MIYVLFLPSAGIYSSIRFMLDSSMREVAAVHGLPGKLRAGEAPFTSVFQFEKPF